MNFLKNGLSIDEFKVSALVLVFLIGFGFAVYSFYVTGDISSNWLDLMKTLIYVIGGVNAIRELPAMIDTINGMKNKTKVSEDYDRYGNDEYDNRI